MLQKYNSYNRSLSHNYLMKAAPMINCFQFFCDKKLVPQLLSVETKVSWYKIAECVVGLHTAANVLKYAE